MFRPRRAAAGLSVPTLEGVALDRRLRRQVAGRLESGSWVTPPARWCGRLWEALADPVRPCRLPSGACVIGVGGATLGGSGKTPVTGALARALADRGKRVAIVAKSYPVSPGPARRVLAEDTFEQVGDEPVMLARALPDIPVVVGSRREGALALAARLGDVLLLDGVLQVRPERLDLSILVLDERLPWGAGRCPPAGDLRASRRRLLDAADVVLIGPAASGTRPSLELARAGYRSDAELVAGRSASGDRWSPDALRSGRVGLALAIARPDRVARTLRQLGIHPVRVHRFGDHGRLPIPAVPLDAWLTSEKCATKLPPRIGRAPVLALEWRLKLPPELVELLERQAALQMLSCRKTRGRVRP